MPIAYHLIVLVLLLFGLATVLLTLATFDGLTSAPPPAAGGAARVSILVPARNEERCIGACVRSLLAQDYPNCELIVLDDQSSDGTPAMLDELGLRPEHPSRRVIRGKPLPDGWVGKCWACHQLAEVATGEWLLFVDADTIHAPGTVSAAVAYATRRRASLVSAWPRLVTVTLGERLIIPMILLLGLTIYPHALLLWLQEHGRGARWPKAWRRVLGAANGQFMFWRRSDYDRLGGHTVVQDHLVEDVALGRAVAERMPEGFRLFNCESLRFSTCRMYRSLGEVWSGFTKNLRPAFERNVANFIVIGLTQLCCYLLPCIFIFTVPRSDPCWPVIATSVAVIALIRVLLAVRFRTSWWSVAFHPLAEALGLAIGLNSWRLAGRRGVLWKGRRYAAAPAN